MKRLALAAALAVALPTTAFADPKDQARELFAAGKRYFDVADYPHAIEAWKQAYVIASSPILLFNIGQAYRLSGDCANATRFYANYEREQPAPPNKTELDEAKAICAKPATPAPPPPVAPVTAPPLVPTTSAQLGQTDLDGGATARPVPVKALPPPSDAGSGGSGLKIAGVTAGGAGLVLLVTGIVFATKASDDANSVTNFTGPWLPTGPNLLSSGHTASDVAVVTTSLGIAALIAGPVMFYLGSRHGHENPLGVAIAPGHTELTWVAHF